MWEMQVNINAVCEIRAKSTIYLGVGAIQKIGDICAALKTKNISKVVVVTGKNSYIKSGAWNHVIKAFEQYNIVYVMYNELLPIPQLTRWTKQPLLHVNMAHKRYWLLVGEAPSIQVKVWQFLSNTLTGMQENFLIAIFTPDKAVPLVAINLTHGTGTEADRFAVVSIPEKEAKPAIAYDCIYPLYSIDDPALMTALPADQTVYVSIDAMNHVIEASTTVAATPFSILLAKETIRLIAQYLPIAKKNPQDLTARYFLLYASLIAGISFDNGLLHYTHALEHPLSAIKPELAHGLGLAVLVPAVVKQIYPASSNILADILSPIITD